MLQNNCSEESCSKNDNPCHTDESREVPLEAILERINHYGKPFQYRSRRQSGYSASGDEPTLPVEIEIEFDHQYDDLENCFDLEGKPKASKQDIIILPPNFDDTKPTNTDEMVSTKFFRKWKGWLKYFLISLLVLALIALTARGIYLEIRHSSDKLDIKSLQNENAVIRECFGVTEECYNT